MTSTPNCDCFVVDLPDDLLSKIIEISGRESYACLASFVRAGNRSKKLVYFNNVLRACSLCPLFFYSARGEPKKASEIFQMFIKLSGVSLEDPEAQQYGDEIVRNIFRCEPHIYPRIEPESISYPDDDVMKLPSCAFEHVFQHECSKCYMYRLAFCLCPPKGECASVMVLTPFGTIHLWTTSECASVMVLTPSGTGYSPADRFPFFAGLLGGRFNFGFMVSGRSRIVAAAIACRHGAGDLQSGVLRMQKLPRNSTHQLAQPAVLQIPPK
ncbi:unnamed protein product [Microthlaspi erraticum]|uniref:Uncharacterized protein n=1 Tax=Microthlaspi erraticum TaxID=1685480 RepID=A0A6D2JKH7_9BRAS|nr:unnamed protein product [Microthlaspi erraticum]